uniref:Uncharacterized protein n=1 Tax=Zooxanthella nutricula TaxID=1333877 RepID=A0A7S2NV68_9DINO|mmetsp:Transcript_39389/g.119052  ORF Transcript_39389/g.119052 Transcript_39389/m.119052 type:complete len:242 (+) Transcript_39389:2-727(+)
MDQAGFSSVAKDPSYPYAMAPTAEMLASFGPEMPGSGVDTFGARYENETRCVTPVPMYGGPQWAAFDNEDGESIFALHRRSRNTLSFCYGGEGVDHINIFHKQQLFSSGYVPFDIGAYAAGLVGYLDAGDGFLWQSGGIINMTMEQKPWGWDRVTTVADLVQPEPWVEWALWYWLPPWLWQLVKLALALQKNIVSHYPLLQIIDGEGKPTKYMDEWLAWAKTIDNGGTLQVKFPNPEPPTP